jgi:hypothetical protein
VTQRSPWARYSVAPGGGLGRNFFHTTSVIVRRTIGGGFTLMRRHLVADPMMTPGERVLVTVLVTVLVLVTASVAVAVNFPEVLPWYED